MHPIDAPSPSGFPMPSFDEIRAMSAPDFIAFWTLYREAFAHAMLDDHAQFIRMAIDLRRKGWEIARGDTLRNSRWLHPNRHHSAFSIEIAHELDARGWVFVRP